MYVDTICSICGEPHTFLKQHLLRSKEARHKACYTAQHNHNQHLKGVTRRTKDTVSYAIYNTYVRAAKRHGRIWDISIGVFRNLINQSCSYCGLAPSTVHPMDRYIGKTVHPYTGLDRVDNNIGYVEGNVVPCCSQCNYAKRNISEQQWKEYIHRLIQFNNVKNNTEAEKDRYK